MSISCARPSVVPTPALSGSTTRQKVGAKGPGGWLSCISEAEYGLKNRTLWFLKCVLNMKPNDDLFNHWELRLRRGFASR